MTTKPTASSTPAATPTDDPTRPLPSHTVDGRPYSPGLEGVVAAETELGLVDGVNGRLLYRGYRIGDLVAHGTFASVANLLWTGTWDPTARLTAGPVPSAVMAALRALPPDGEADGRAAHRRVGLGRHPDPRLATHRDPGTRPDGVLALSPRRLRAPARGPRADRPRPEARRRLGAFSTS